MAVALTEDCDRQIFCTSGKELNLKTVKKLFKTARKSANPIILIDDIDYLHKNEDSDTYEQLLREMKAPANGEVFVIVTADEKERVPEYLLDEINPDMLIE